MDLTLLLSLIALIPFAVYFLQRALYTPRIFFRIAGEQLGEPIPIPKNGTLNFAVGTMSRRRLLLSEVWVYFDAGEANLFKTKGAMRTFMGDKKSSSALFFPQQRLVAHKLLQGNFFSYEAEGSNFAVRLACIASIAESELPFLLDMFPPRKVRVERLVKFKIVENPSQDPKERGIVVGPGETLAVEGPQAQAEVWAATDTPGTKVRVLEELDDSSSQD